MTSSVAETNKYEETFELGRRLAAYAKPGTVICLNGELGTGKTVFTQGFAEGLGVDGPVNSPTFTIVQEYHTGRLPFYHFDVYRIGDISELEDIGCEEYLYGDGVCLIEWASMVRDIIPEDAVQVTIEKDLEKGFDYRKITITK